MEYPVDTVMDLYCYYRQKYVLMRDDVTMHVKAPYTSKQVWEHLNGNISMCVFAGPSNTSFLSIDIDMKEPDVVRTVIDTMEDLGIPRSLIYVSDSGGKGYHVEIFFADSIYNWKAKELYGLIIYFGGLDKRKVEYRPTATQSIKLPLGIHQKTQSRCWFVDRETLEPIKDFQYIETIERIPVWQVEQAIKNGNVRRFYKMLEEIKAKEDAGVNSHGSARKKRQTQSPESITIEEEGTRQKCMVAKALQLYRDGGDYNSIHRDLTNWMLEQDPAMYKDSWDEIRRNINNITSWVMRCGRRRELGDDPNHEYHEKTRIFESDAKRIASAPTRSARMLAFLFTVFCDQYGFCGMSYKKLGEIVDHSGEKTMRRAVDAFQEMNLFHVQKGGFSYRGDTLHKVTNKYKFPKDYERTGEYIEIDGLVTPENIYDLYISTIAALCSDGDIRHLTSPEKSDIRKARRRQDAS